MCFCSLADAHLILQTDPDTQTCQDVLVEDPGAGSDQGTTPVEAQPVTLLITGPLGM